MAAPNSSGAAPAAPPPSSTAPQSSAAGGGLVAGGFHLVPFLSQHSDALIAASRLAKYGKRPTPVETPAAAASAESGGGESTNTEFALCTHATLKLRLLPDPTSKQLKWALLWRQSHACIRRVVPLDVASPTVVDAATSAATGGARRTAAAPPVPPVAVLVVEFFSDKPSRKSAMAACDHLKKLYDAIAVPMAVETLRGASPELRGRMLVFPSSFARDEWLVLFHAALTNYWHERLERAYIAAPQIYQYHSWAVCVDSSQQDKMGAAAAANGAGGSKTWCQVALSTTKLYLISRPNRDALLSDATTPHSVQLFAAALGKVEVSSSMPKVKVANKSGETWCELLWLERTEAVQFVVELQRVWEMVAVPATAASGTPMPAFPVEIVG